MIKFRFLAAWVAVLAFSLFSSGADALSLDEVVNRVQARYEKTGDFSANFQQTSTLASLKKEQSAAGKVYIQKPGKMRWEYQSPEKQLIVSDGETVWVYNPGLGQVIENPLSNAYDSKTPALFLAGVGNLKKDFDIRFSPRQTDPQKGNYLLELMPKDPQLYLSKLEILINRDDYAVERSTAYDPQGNVITLQFSNIQTNVGLSTSIFQFKAPKGVERIHLPTFPLKP